MVVILFYPGVKLSFCYFHFKHQTVTLAIKKSNLQKKINLFLHFGHKKFRNMRKYHYICIVKQIRIPRLLCEITCGRDSGVSLTKELMCNERSAL